MKGAKVGSFRRRQAWLGSAILVLLVAFGVRLVFVQIVDGPALAEEGLKKRVQEVDEPAPRGDILDANGAVLATSVERYLVVVDQRQVPEYKEYDKDDTLLGEGPAHAAQKVAPILDISQDKARKLLTGEAGYVKLAEAATPEQWRLISALRIPGVTATSFYQRVYPAGTLAGNILGYGFEDAAGKRSYTGIEGGMDKVLTGIDGKQQLERGNGGQVIPGGVVTGQAAQPGRDVQLTIDWDLQWYAQQALAQQVKKTKAQWGTAVVINVKTGEILALADTGSVNPNNPGETPAAARGSRAVESVFEPGSTAKVITMAMVLEQGIAKPTSKYRVPSKLTYEGQTYIDSHDHGTSPWTLTGILANSSNVGTIMSAQKIPYQVRYDYLSKFGFGKETGVELPSETSGTLHAAKDWDGRTAQAVLFGQGVTVNSLQATGVFATIANGGVSMPIHLVKGVSDESGKLQPAAPGKATRVISASSAGDVMKMLESVVDDGTGTEAAIPGYRVVGKTGTSQMPDAKGKLTKHASSFIGVVPAEDPQLAIGVVLFEPKTSVYGGVVSAPVFQKVGSFALQQRSVPPSTTQPRLFPTTW